MTDDDFKQRAREDAISAFPVNGLSKVNHESITELGLAKAEQHALTTLQKIK